MSYLYRLRTVVAVVSVLMGIVIGFGITLLIDASVLRRARSGATPLPASPSSAMSRSESEQSVNSVSPALPTTAPTTEPTPSQVVPTSAPTITLSAVPTPVPTTDLVTTLLAQVVEAETTLQQGHLEATLLSPDGTRTSSLLQFDLGDGQRVPRLQSTTTYQSADGTQTIEQVIIGAQTWQRQPDGSWATVAEQAGVWDQLQPFLAYAAGATQPKLTTDDRTATLQWYDAGRDADVTLVVARATGTPQTLQRATRATSTVLTVTYSGWNTAVEMSPPEGN